MEGRPLDERQLVDSAKNGDLAAYNELVRVHQSTAIRVAFLVLRDASEAEDAAQEAFVKAYRALGRFRVEAEFRPWLLRIVRNEALNRRRTAGRRARLVLRVASDPVSGDAAPSPETEVVKAEERQQLLDALEGLPVRLRAVVECRYLLGLSEFETAGILGIAPGTVKSRAARAVGRLRTAMGGGHG